MNMQCIMVREVGNFEIASIPVPEPEHGEALIRVDITGLCRTDLKLVRQGHRDLTLPRVPGEEVVGVVKRLGGPGGDIREGDRVYVYPGTWCGNCPSCRRDAHNLCRAMRIMGFHRDGGFAQYVKAPLRSLIRVPDDLTAEKAVFAEPLSCCLNALELARLEEGERIAIWGAGPAGTLLARAAKNLGAQAVNIDPDSRRRRLIGGLSSGPLEPFDVCVVAVGDHLAYEEALKCLAPRGRLVIFSGIAAPENHRMVDFNQLHYYEQTLVGAYGCSYRHGLEALHLIAEGSVPVMDMISHRMSLWQLDKALDLVIERTGMKILLDPWNEDTY
ncbi:MAG: alcohol dehydrogenase catalytic domain-containing protein [Syntrophales bacterium]|nr:alcohol dehydrogenase catalytic domain-containing protein [Syntrophales bacterium]